MPFKFVTNVSVQKEVLLAGIHPAPTPPAPAPAPVVVPTALCPQLFLVETYHLRTLRTATGKGSQVSSIQFLPGEEKVIEISTSVTQSSDVTSTTTAMESQDDQVAKNFNDHVSEASEKTGSQETNDYDLHANFHGDASMGFGSGEANAQLDVHGGSNSVRNGFSNAVQNGMDSQIAHTAQSRRQTVSEQSSTNSTDQSAKTVSTDKVKNPNPSHTVNFIWYQLVEQYVSFLTLDNVDVAFINTDSQHTQIRVPLHDLDSLLNKVLEPNRVDQVRSAIKTQLGAVLDYQDRPRNIVEEVPLGDDKSILRINNNLQSQYLLKDSNGELVRTINVDGVLIKAFINVLPSRSLVVDSVVGQSSVI
jgi:hypothetical protein